MLVGHVAAKMDVSTHRTGASIKREARDETGGRGPVRRARAPMRGGKAH